MTGLLGSYNRHEHVVTAGRYAEQIELIGTDCPLSGAIQLRTVRDEIDPLRVEREIDVRLHEHESPRVAALVHLVIDKTRVSPHRDTLARGIEIGFSRYCILVVAEVVAHIGQQL